MRRRLRVATGVAVVIPVVTIGSARALDGHGHLVVLGASPWDVKERCGEPNATDDVTRLGQSTTRSTPVLQTIKPNATEAMPLMTRLPKLVKTPREALASACFTR
jgi:hypothetical protein